MMWDGTFDESYRGEKPPKVNNDLNNLDWMNIYAILDEAHSLARMPNTDHFYNRGSELNRIMTKIANLFEKEPKSKELDAFDEEIDYNFNVRDWLNIYSCLSEAYSISATANSYFRQQYNNIGPIMTKLQVLFQGAK